MHSLSRQALIAAGACAALLAGVMVLARTADHPGSGTVVLLGTRPAGASASEASVSEIRLRETGGRWRTLVSQPLSVSLAAARAPGEVTLGTASGPALSYDRARIRGLGFDREFSLRMTLAADKVVPLLLVVGDRGVSAVYSGPEVNIGLQEIAGTFPRAPDFSLRDQLGDLVTLSGLAGRTVVVAPFDTLCTESCPLVNADLVALRAELARVGLADRVSILEIDMAPAHDSPELLLAYTHEHSLEWPVLSGTEPEIDAALAGLGVGVERSAGNVISHTAALVVIDGHGYIRRTLTGDAGVAHPSPQLLSSLSSEGLVRLAHPSWTLAEAVARVEEVAGYQGHPAPAANALGVVALDLPALSGPRIRIAALKGRPVLVDFWASYCEPCRRELPMLSAAARSHPELALVGVDEGEDPSVGRGYLRGLHLQIASVADPDRSAGTGAGVFALPTAVFIDASGQVISTVVGQLDEATLRLRLADIGVQ